MEDYFDMKPAGIILIVVGIVIVVWVHLDSRRVKKSSTLGRSTPAKKPDTMLLMAPWLAQSLL